MSATVAASQQCLVLNWAKQTPMLGAPHGNLSVLPKSTEIEGSCLVLPLTDGSGLFLAWCLTFPLCKAEIVPFSSTGCLET